MFLRLNSQLIGFDLCFYSFIARHDVGRPCECVFGFAARVSLAEGVSLGRSFGYFEGKGFLFCG